MTPAQTFYPLAVFLEAFLALYRQLRRPDEDRLTRERKARELSITLCLRTFRGVPDLEQAGVCYSKDVVYLRGLLLIEQAVAEDPRLLARLSVGRVALEALPTVERLGVMPVVHPLRKLVEAPDLESTILSFETQGTGQ
jgi:hypothetical protein